MTAVRRVVMLVLLSSIAWTSARADTPERDEAKRAFTEGKRQYTLGEYRAALVAFKRAYLLYEAPAFVFNIAQCHKALGENVLAVQFYERYLQLAPDAPDAAEVRGIIEVLRAPPPTAAPPATVNATLTIAPTPVYKRWWLWTTVGVVVVGVGLGVGLGLGLRTTNHFSSTLPEWRPGQ